MLMNNNTNTITFKHMTYTRWKAYYNLTLWYTKGNTWSGQEFRMIATDADGEVKFVGQDFEHITGKILNGESGYGMTGAESVVRYLNTYR